MIREYSGCRLAIPAQKAWYNVQVVSKDIYLVLCQNLYNDFALTKREALICQVISKFFENFGRLDIIAYVYVIDIVLFQTH